MNKPRIKYKALYEKEMVQVQHLEQEIFQLIAEKHQLIDELGQSVFTKVLSSIKTFFSTEGRQEVA